MPNAAVIANRYRVIAPIGTGGMGEVFRVEDRLANEFVALKKVRIHDGKDNTMDLTADYRLSLAEEFKVLSSLRHPYIISVLDYGFDRDRQPFFTMELLETPQNIVKYSQTLDEDGKAALLVQLLQAIAYLHRRGIIHRDVKPDNVMIVNGQVKVLDFGLATARSRLSNEDEYAVGTIAYMAPEVLGGMAASESSDLYACGVVAYEMFAGGYPFNRSDVMRLVFEIVHNSIDPEEIDANPMIQGIISTLLEKNPDLRQRSAHEVIRSLDKATTTTLPVETSLTRESYLQAAAFVGREQEMAQLIAGLRRAQDGSGGSFLVGGESGVGKSRLLDELRTQALVSGAQVLRGQSVREGGAPYHVWLPILRQLALQTNLDELEARVLKSIIPDMNELVDYPVEEAPEIEEASRQNRLLNIVESIFKKQPELLVILLDDLQWEDESIALLERIARLAPSLRLLIVGTFRNEERPELPQELPQMHPLILSRLTQSEMATLSRSMLGEVGQSRNVLDLLKRETEGNIYFIIEVLRTLAEEAGDLEAIGNMTLPAHVFSGGVASVVQRRLASLSATVRPVLELAALSGREIDVALLQHVLPDQDVFRILSNAMDAAVVEVRNDRWEFAHDQLRTALLNDMDSAQQRRQHVLLAQGIEALYGEDPTAFARLALHWKAAADDPQADRATIEKAIHYLELTAEQDVSSNSFHEAIRRINDVFGLFVRLEGNTHLTQLDEARWHFILSQAQAFLRYFDASRQDFERAAQLYGFPIPQTTSGLLWKIFQQVLTQMLHRLLPAAFYQVRQDSAERERLLAVARTDQFAGTTYFVIHQQLRSLYTTLHSINASERAGQSPELAESYALMCTTVGNLQLDDLAHRYYERAVEMARTLDEPAILGRVLFLTAIYHSGAAKREVVERDLREAVTIFAEVGDPLYWGYAKITLASQYYRDAHFNQAYTLYSAILEQTAARIPQHEVVCLNFQARIDMNRGHLDGAMDKLDRATQLMAALPEDLQLELEPRATQALLRWAVGDQLGAYEAAEHTWEIVERAQITANLGNLALTAVAVIYLLCYEADDGTFPITRPDLLQRAEKAVKRLNQLPPPSAQPAALRVKGWLLWLRGKEQRAIKLWRKGIEKAQDLALSQDEALTRFEWGRHLPPNHPDRANLLRTALEQFEANGSARDQRIAQYELEKTSTP